MVEREGREPIMNTLPHVAWNLRRILEKEQFWLEEHRMWVRGNEGIPGHDEPHNCVDL